MYIQKCEDDTPHTQTQILHVRQNPLLSTATILYIYMYIYMYVPSVLNFLYIILAFL